MRCFVKDDRFGFIFERFECFSSFVVSGGKEAFKYEFTRKQTGERQRTNSSAGTWNDGNGDTLFRTDTNDILTGVTDGGHTRIGDQRTSLARFDTGNDHFTALTFIMLKIAHHRLFDSEIRKQFSRISRILGGNKVYFIQHLQRTLGNIGKIADRRTNEIQRPLLRDVFLGIGSICFFKVFDITHGKLRFHKYISYRPYNCRSSAVFRSGK